MDKRRCNQQFTKLYNRNHTGHKMHVVYLYPKPAGLSFWIGFSRSFLLWKQCFNMWSPPDMWSYRWKCLIISGRGHQDRPSSVSLPENNVEKPSSMAWNNCPSVSVPSKITHRRQFRNIVHVSSSFGSGIPLHVLEELKSRLKNVLAHSFLLKHFSSCSTFLSFSFLTKYSNLFTFLFKIIF